MGGVGEKIMMSALTGVMSPVLGKLTSLIEKYTELKNVRKTLEQLRKELIAINIALEKYAAMESPDVQVKAWMAEMRELAYDLEDSIDLFTHHVDHEPADTTGVKSFFRKKIRKLKRLHYRYRFAEEIKELLATVKAAEERRKRYKIREGSSGISHTEIDPRLRALYVEVEKLVGIEKPSQEVISRLVGENPEERRSRSRRVVSIVGPGGSGKTTLAKQVYEKIKDQFSCVAFVSVSQKPNMSNLLRELQYQIGVSRSMATMRSCSDQLLIDQLRSYLENQRYLVVIDDVWTQLAWDTIQCALPRNGHTSRVIMTTRINSVGQFCCTSDEGFVYEMKPLSRSDSENLFVKRIFCSEDKFPIQLEGIKNEIFEKCDGLPLAIVTLASLLATKPRTKEEWERALNSISCMNEKDSGLEVMDKILSLSYNELPHHMRNCLLHLCTFPEDHEIYKDILVWRWVAEGFITEKQGYTLQQVGESYFYEFINRNLIQPITLVPRYGMCEVEEGCRVHDIILNFLISRSAEENFVTVLDSQGLPSSDRRVRRLSVWSNPIHVVAVFRGTMNLSHLRSINICNVGGWTMPRVLDLPVLRVLDLDIEEYSAWSTVDRDGTLSLFLLRFCRKNGVMPPAQTGYRIVDPDCILSLFHLRYLRFGGESDVMLPAQIGSLQYLQTLDLSGAKVTQLPESIVQLKRLMCLVGYQLIMPNGFGNMQSLQELGNLDGCNCSVSFGEDLALLSKLRVLRVTFMWSSTSDLRTRKESLLSSLCKLGQNSLRCVYIYDNVGGGDCFVDSWCPSPCVLQKFIHISKHLGFPKWISSCLSDLTYLDILVQKMEREHLSILGDLPAIRFLYLDVKQVTSDGLVISHGAFPSLTCFQFYNIDGPALVFEGGMRMLEWLRLGFDADKAQSTYGTLEVGIGNLSSVKRIGLTVRVISEGENDPVEKAVKSVIDGQVQMLPNCPTVDIGFSRRSRLAGR
ncbi:unnamed protein product [Urochloa decumbens]|uniref:AAA+ ATPase domain-containing protein n=1 Tax=Urochloa decumbens TaxID=240449 RepID=A0ABC9ER60_9POAL